MKIGSKLNIVFILLRVSIIFSLSLIQAQSKQKVNKIKNLTDITGEVQSVILNDKDKFGLSKSLYNNSSELYGSDTLNQDLEYNVPFTFSPGDVMVKWFEAPTDMILNGCGINLYAHDEYDENASVEVKVVKLNYTAENIMAYKEAKYLGYYIGTDFFGRSAFEDDPNTTGDWVDIGGDGPPFGEDLWGDNGYGRTITVDQFNLEAGEYTYVDFSKPLDMSPEIKKGEIFGIAVRNTTPPDVEQPDMWIMANGERTYPCFKFYQYGRLLTDPSNSEFDGGWWIRTFYTWNINAVVTLTGDIAPEIEFITKLSGTPSTDPVNINARITDRNPSGGATGIAQALLQYSLDDGNTYSDIPMTENGGIYSADIPGQSPGSEIKYRIYAEDINGNSATADGNSYLIFKSENPTLVIFNGSDVVGGYPNAYYFGDDGFEDYTTLNFSHDRWAYGEITPELLDNYSFVIEITAAGKGPSFINNDLIRDWLESESYRNYMLIGDEWLSAQSGRVDKAYESGSFQYDILGITYGYNDIDDDSGNNVNSTIVLPVQGSLLGGRLYNLLNSISGADTMYYDPYYEIGIENHLDGAEVLTDVNVDMKAVVSNGEQFNIGFHRTLPSGNRIAVFLYDVLSVNSGPEYYWFGFSASSPQVEAVRWMEPMVHTYGVTVTFRVDVTTLVDRGLFNPETDTVYVRGSFNAWSKTYPMQKTSLNRYNFWAELAPNKEIEYKYFISSEGAPNNGWETFPNDVNRTWDVGDNPVILPLVYFNNEIPNAVKKELPDKYNLSQNYPNPFNPATVIAYSLAEKSSVTLDLYNLLGEVVEELVGNSIQLSGNYELEFDASGYSSGVYFYKLFAVGEETGKVYTKTRKMLLVK